MKRLSWNISAIFALSLWGLIGGTASAQTAFQPGEVIAMLNGEPIYLSEIGEQVSFQVFRLQTSIQTLLKKETEDIVNRRLLAAEASRRKMTVEALLQQEVYDQVPPVTEQQVEQYTIEHPDDSPKSSDRISRIKTYLSERARMERKLEYLASLRAKADFQFLLQAPERPRVKVSLAGAPWRGFADAPVTLVHFTGIRCRFCSESVGKIQRAVVDFPGRIKWVHRYFFNIQDEEELLAAEIGRALHAQGSFWDFYDRVFSSARSWTAEELRQAGRDAGLDLKKFDEERRKGKYLLQVKDDIATGVRIGIEGPPVILVNGIYFSGTLPYADLKSLIEKELRRAGSEEKTPRATSLK